MGKTKRGSTMLKRAAMREQSCTMLKRAAIREQSRGKVAICPNCNTWFGDYQTRNDHRAKCPKRRKA